MREISGVWQPRKEAAKPETCPTVSPNRMKFASLIQKLSPHNPGFANEVARLQADYEDRDCRTEKLQAFIRGLMNEDGPHKALDYNKTDVLNLQIALEAAVERFVVDNF